MSQLGREESIMQVFTRNITGIDGSIAHLDAYVIDNSAEMDPHRHRPAVIICPGGAYKKASDREGEPVALRMLGFGYNAFVLRYSCAPSRWPVALLELAEAVRQVRGHADDWHVDPHAVVVMGFSVGGQIASGLATQCGRDPVFADHGYAEKDVRPNGLAMGYGVTDAEEWGHRPSLMNQLGPDQADLDSGVHDSQLADRLTTWKHVDSKTPSSFIWQTSSDAVVSPMNSLLFARACCKNGVPVELHLFPLGNHGLSVGTRETAVSLAADPYQKQVEPAVQVWPSLFKKWMDRMFPADVFD